MGLPSLALFLLILCFPAFSMQQDAPIYLQCMRNTTSLSSSTFASNLNTALRNFTTLSSQGSKYGTAAGNSGLYAVFQCRGDLSAQSCGQCVQNVTARLPQECPNSVGARIRFDACFLRYDNQSFFSLDTTYVMGYCNTANTSDVVTLSTIADLMESVTSEAPKQDGYWASAREIGVYAAAQCLGYLSQSECSQCLSSYSYRVACDSKLGGQVHLASCDYRFETYNFMESTPPEAAAPAPSLLAPVAAPRPPSLVAPQSPAGSKTLITAVSASVGFVVVVGVLLCAILVWRRRCKTGKEKGAKPVDKTASWSRQLLQKKAELFSLEELEEATGHFHPTNKLGEGGFGIVYKGTLKNGEQVAIKKLSIGSQQGKQEFLNEVNLITSVQHKNLVRLLGCCVEGLERMLVYEYLLNKSLDFFLARGNRILNWSTRYGIVVGMAKGLAYLHEESHTQIIHRDIKPSNILLDDQLNPVIADFGLARLVKDDATHVNTGVAGTIGYLAPEYALNGVLSEKVDVFSFGLVTLEVITGKQNVHSRLLTWVWEKYRDEKVLELVDEKLGNAFAPEQVIRVVHVALLCTQENPKQRPTMSRVILWLSGMSAILEIPIRPTFLVYNDSTASAGDSIHQSTSTSSTCSQSTNAFGGEVPWISGGVLSMSEIIDPR
ncbi:hypothetical protein GOP47_0015191 [Adiantum capillus-veneris]|uniref:Uncharacterized protein n=1 Tax=Adiantum capillus-veneris TaxID=13818 RepID=A0A9D4UP53_ADICA|nr:hypothetical protein GOP47_0015191 [Adiantum capillus-veneris]